MMSASMYAYPQLPQPASRHALAVIRSPDRHANWTVVVVATLEPQDMRGLTHTGPNRLESLRRNLAQAHAAIPLIGARLHGDTWVPGPAPDVLVTDGEPVASDLLTGPFTLHDEAPVRVVLGAAGTRLAVAAHHAAFDGLGVTAVCASLLGPPPTSPVVPRRPGPTGGLLTALSRLARPVNRVAPSVPQPRAEAFCVRTVKLSGPGVTARVAAACVSAVASRNRAHGARWERIGISIGVGGTRGAGNTASYRSVNVRRTDDVAHVVAAAIADAREPIEQVHAVRTLRLLSPVIYRFSDSFLVSNLGVQELPSVRKLDFFPVARGRSAVAFGLAGLTGKPPTISIRARDLSEGDARNLLDEVVARLESHDQ